jgi:hypothetical protein
MERKDQTNKGSNQKHENPLPHEIPEKEKEVTRKAHLQAEQDISNDAELSAHSPNDDLDEGESARLGEKTDLI